MLSVDSKRPRSTSPFVGVETRSKAARNTKGQTSPGFKPLPVMQAEPAVEPPTFKAEATNDASSPSSLLSSSGSSGPTLGFNASNGSSVMTTPDSNLYPTAQQPQHSVFADIKQWSTQPASDSHRATPDFFASPTLPSPQAQTPAYAAHFLSNSGGSGSSYRGSMDELMGTGANPSASPTTQFMAGSMSGLGLDAFAQAAPLQPPAAAYAQSAQNVPADFIPPFSQIYRETRKGQDLGLSLEDFEVLETLGTGTFGRVLLCRLLRAPLPNLPTYFAIKVLSKMDVVRLKQVQHINSERAILASVRHSGLVNLFVVQLTRISTLTLDHSFCTFQDERNLYLLMEFIQGGELFSHLRRAGRFSADVARFYAANIIVALEYLHNRDIIYRDLKPENLLLDHQGYIKITDFGFAKFVPDRTFTLCGTPEYLAPEIIQSTGHGKAADYWALGVLLFEMMCGYPAFWADNPLGIYEKILGGRVHFPEHVHPVARDLIRRLLQANLTRRLGNLKGGTRDIMAHAWFEGVDWDLVRRRMIPAPITPRARSEGDCSHFEKYAQVELDSLPAFARAHRKRYALARGIWKEPSEVDKERLRRQIELDDIYAGYFLEF